MLKPLIVFIFFVLSIAAANAQTAADSSVKRSGVDTIIKRIPTDTVRKLPADTLIKHHPADSVIKHPPADTLIKHPSADSVVKRPHTDSIVRHSDIKIIVKPMIDTVSKHSPVRILSDRRYFAYLKGEDPDSMSLVGELNHFPLPDKVLKYKKQLDLSPIQVGQLNQLATALHRKKMEMGSFIIRNEKMLDSLFHARRLDEGTIIFYANRSGLYLGELRVAILLACYNTEKLLTDYQIKKLEVLEKAN